MELFDYQMSGQMFREGDKGYIVILHPILPHETPNNASSISDRPDPFNLPFSCENIDLPEIIPTPTPTPFISTLSPEAGELRGRITFSSDRDGNDEIYTMYADGSHVTRITNYPGYDGEPVWSPDGQQIAFVSDRSGRDEIYVMNADGTDVTQVTVSSSYKESPAWSPDGSRIAYVNTHNADFPDSDAEIHIIGVDGNNPIQLTNNGKQVEDIHPVWLNQTQIIYTAGDYPAYLLYTMRDSGDERSYLSYGTQPAISPDGKRLAYVITEFVKLGNSVYTEYNEIHVSLMPDWRTNQDYSAQITEEDKSNHSPIWSPDGQRIIFVSTRDGNAELYVMNADGSNPIRLTFTTAAERDPDWTP